ncbi:hypothetical protein TD95_003788 [Thielaviopsis punctulata]|uniref:FAS1 domain-containing protein n=1 Tax=Thielaviopsis punctulata TaxID=72032 RepID=A0A0F4ZDM9_9PEZI|nr:hypothetical protein TD95_003788 [Thielaviopsis punctulata]
MNSQQEILLSDVIGSFKNVSLFANLIREFPDIEQRISDPNLKTTLLAPHNTAIESMNLKTWERQEDYDSHGLNAYSGEEGRTRAKENNRKFLLSHIVTEFPWTHRTQTVTLGGQEICWVDFGEAKMILPQKVYITSTLKRVRNGDLLLISAALQNEEPRATM